MAVVVMEKVETLETALTNWNIKSRGDMIIETGSNKTFVQQRVRRNTLGYVSMHLIASQLSWNQYKILT